MSDLHLNLRTAPDGQPGDDEAREARHQVLATLLGAFADGELPPETVSQIDAHLLGCARCRREVALHAAVRARLSREPLAAASAALRDRIAGAVARTPMPADPAPLGTPSADRARFSRRSVAAAIALVIAALTFAATRARDESGTASAATRTTPRVDAAAVPLFAAIIADYRRVMAGDLPGRARDLDAVRASVPFPVEPLRDTTLRLLAVWSSDLLGEPTAVLAYRWHDRLVLEYLVSEPTFFRHHSVRTAIADGGGVLATSGTQGLRAWTTPSSGAILVADVTPAALLALHVADEGR